MPAASIERVRGGEGRLPRVVRASRVGQRRFFHADGAAGVATSAYAGRQSQAVRFRLLVNPVEQTAVLPSTKGRESAAHVDFKDAIRDHALAPVAGSRAARAFREERDMARERWRGDGLIACFGVLYACVARYVLDAFPFAGDEYSVLLQAELLRPRHAAGSRSCARRVDGGQPRVIDDWVRSKYPPGMAALLAVGERLGAALIVNPLLGVATLVIVWSTFRRVLGDKPALVGLVAVGLAPLFAFHAASFFSHTASSLFLAIAFTAVARWLDPAPLEQTRARSGGYAWFVLCGVALGCGFLVRPFDALLFGVAMLFLRSMPAIAITAASALPFVGLSLLYQNAQYGSPFIDGYSVYAPTLGAIYGVQAGGPMLSLGCLVDPLQSWFHLDVLRAFVVNWTIPGTALVAMLGAYSIGKDHPARRRVRSPSRSSRSTSRRSCSRRQTPMTAPVRGTSRRSSSPWRSSPRSASSPRAPPSRGGSAVQRGMSSSWSRCSSVSLNSPPSCKAASRRCGSVKGCSRRRGRAGCTTRWSSCARSSPRNTRATGRGSMGSFTCRRRLRRRSTRSRGRIPGARCGKRSRGDLAAGQGSVNGDVCDLGDRDGSNIAARATGHATPFSGREPDCSLPEPAPLAAPSWQALADDHPGRSEPCEARTAPPLVAALVALACVLPRAALAHDTQWLTFSKFEATTSDRAIAVVFALNTEAVLRELQATDRVDRSNVDSYGDFFSKYLFSRFTIRTTDNPASTRPPLRASSGTRPAITSSPLPSSSAPHRSTISSFAPSSRGR